MRKTFVNNMVAISAARLSQPIFNFVLSLIIARLLGAKIFGAYATVFFILIVFQMCGSLGLKAYLTREVAKERRSISRYFINVLILMLPISIINCFLMIEIVELFKYETLVLTPVIILSFSLIASGIADCLEGILQGLEKIQTIAVVWFLEHLLRVVISVLAIYQGYGLNEICIIYVLTRFLNPIILFLVLSKQIKSLMWRPDYQVIKELIRAAKIFGPALVTTALFWQTDSILMSKILGLEEVGIYNAAFRLFRFLIIFVQSFVAVFYPIACSLSADQSFKFELICKKSIFYMFILLLPIVVTISIFAVQITDLIWGAEYKESAAVLQVLVWCILPFMISKIFTYTLIASNFQSLELRITMIGTVIKIVVLVLMMKALGYLGTALANLFAVSVLVIVQVPFVIKKLFRFEISNIVRLSWKIVFAVISMVIVAQLLMDFNFWAAMIIANIVYFSVLWLIKVFTQYDKKLFCQLARINS